MSKAESIELNRIYNMNCLDGLSGIENASIDLIVTDPPYAIGTTSNGTKGTWNDNNLIKPFFEKLFKEYERVLKDGASLYINTDWRTYPLLYPMLNDYFNVKNLIVWDYGWIKAGSHYRFRHEFIIYATKGDCKRKFSASEPDVWEMKPINFTSRNKLHGAEKPVHLYRRMIENSSKAGDVVLDTFLGSGTSIIACLDTERNYIGFEIDKKYFNVANKRIETHKRRLVGEFYE